jgi:hypothetical protein
MSQDQEKNYYTPSEAAKILGISVQSLKYYRLDGRVEGTDIGNTTLYTQEQLNAADLSRKKPGPKRGKKGSIEGESEGDQGLTSSVMLKDSGRLLGMAS